MYVCMIICVYVCMYDYMYVCMIICMYVCMYTIWKICDQLFTSTNFLDSPRGIHGEMASCHSASDKWMVCSPKCSPKYGNFIGLYGI
jgi:hypothetical protein